MQEIKIQLRDVYGKTNAYAACSDAQKFADIAGTKTLTAGTLCLILSLGYTIIEINRLGGEITRYRSSPGEVSRLLPRLAA
jgi:hypothetical protein